MNYNSTLDSLLQLQAQQQRYFASISQKSLPLPNLKAPMPPPFPTFIPPFNPYFFPMMNAARFPTSFPPELLKTRALSPFSPPTSMLSLLSTNPSDLTKTIPPKTHPSDSKNTISDTIHISKEKSFKTQLREVLEYVVNNVGKISETELEKAREKLADDKKLSQVFEALVTKYSASVKTKENVIKYVLRKVFKSMKENLMKEKGLDSKGACGAFVEKYFPETKIEFKEKDANDDEEEELFNALMPFKKNSKNKTMNNNFLVSIFSSEPFRIDYNIFVANLDDSMFADNYQKVERFLVYIQECVEKGAYKDIGKFKRLPWLKLWMEKTKETASDLVHYARRNVKSKSKKDSPTVDRTVDSPKKLVKNEENSSDTNISESTTAV